MSLIPIPPEAENATKAALAYAEAVHVEVTTPDQYLSAGDVLKQVKARGKALEELRVKLTAPILAAKKNIDEMFRNPIARLSLAEGQIKSAMVFYDREVQRKADEERRRLQAEADAKAEAERKRLAEAAAKAREEKAAEVQAPQVQVTVPVVKVGGTQMRDCWKYRVVNADLVPREFLAIDEKKLGQHARANRDTVPVAGVEFYNEPTMAVRT